MLLKQIDLERPSVLSANVMTYLIMVKISAGRLAIQFLSYNMKILKTETSKATKSAKRSQTTQIVPFNLVLQTLSNKWSIFSFFTKA